MENALYLGPFGSAHLSSVKDLQHQFLLVAQSSLILHWVRISFWI